MTGVVPGAPSRAGFVVPGSPEGCSVHLPFLVRAMAGEDLIDDVPIDAVDDAPAGGFLMRGRGLRFAAVAAWSGPVGPAGRRDVTLDVATLGGQVEAGLVVAIRLAPTAAPRWLIPGLFYGENGPAGSRRLYPRYAPSSDDDPFTSTWWGFRADRAAVPVVFGWGGEGSAGLATTETSALGLSGIGFSGQAADVDGPELRLAFPYREEPVAYDGSATPLAAARPVRAWRSGERVRLQFRVYAGPPDLHAWAPAVRDLHAWLAPASPLGPWVTAAEAAELAADGLRRWHYRAEPPVILETAAFERPADPSRQAAGSAPADRRAMHVAWQSGIPSAQALLGHGRLTDDASLVEAGEAVIDHVVANLAPCGTFWGQWTDERGWGKDWSPGDHRLQARTIAEAALFLGRASWSEAAAGVDRPGWRAALASNLEFIEARQREDGCLPSAWNGQTGSVDSWDGAAGLAWVPALAEGASIGGRTMLEAARLAGRYYARFVDDEFIHGASQDLDVAPTSEDGYVAVMAYVSLVEAEEDRLARARWLDLARRAADWTLSFRYAWNVAFEPTSLLGSYDYRTRGADQASPADQHLHGYGLVCLPEMVRLSRHLGDPWYLERTRENLACFRQFIARSDGDFGARRGMAPGRYYQTECSGPRGDIGPLSHAWCLGLLLHACDQARTMPELADAFEPPVRVAGDAGRTP